MLSNSRKSYLEQYVTKKQFAFMGQKTTVCLLTIYNEFEIVGTSTCADVNDFNEDVGEMLAYERAMEELNRMFIFLEQDRQHLYKK